MPKKEKYGQVWLLSLWTSLDLGQFNECNGSLNELLGSPIPLKKSFDVSNEFTFQSFPTIQIVGQQKNIKPI